MGKHLPELQPDRKSTRLNSSHLGISYAVFCLKKKKRLMTQVCTDRGVAAVDEAMRGVGGGGSRGAGVSVGPITFSRFLYCSVFFFFFLKPAPPPHLPPSPPPPPSPT